VGGGLSKEVLAREIELRKAGYKEPRTKSGVVAKVDELVKKLVELNGGKWVIERLTASDGFRKGPAFIGLDATPSATSTEGHTTPAPASTGAAAVAPNQTEIEEYGGRGGVGEPSVAPQEAGAPRDCHDSLAGTAAAQPDVAVASPPRKRRQRDRRPTYKAGGGNSI